MSTSLEMPLRPNRDSKTASNSFGKVIHDLLKRPLADYYLLLAAVALLIGVGSLMVLSSSSVWSAQESGDSYALFKNQMIILGVAIVFAVILARLPAKFYKPLGWLAMIFAIVLLILVFTPLGRDVYGNRAWLELGPIGMIQPSEFAKLALIVWAAGVFANRGRSLAEPRKLLFPFLAGFGVVLGLVAAQRDLGTALVIGLIMMAMLWFAGANLKVLLSLGGVALAGVAAMIAVNPGRMQRIFNFVSGTAADGDQPMNAIFGLASGGWWGVGLGASRQKWGGLYNGAQTDYIFAVLGEELGLIGSLSVLILFALVGFAGFRIAVRSSNRFFRYAAAGITAWIVIQAVLNIAVAMRLLPVFGVPLPFLSQGGSALLANVMAVGVLLAAARNEPQAVKYRLIHKSNRPKLTSVLGTR